MRNRTLTIAAALVLLTGWLVVPGLASAPPGGSLLNRILGYRTLPKSQLLFPILFLSTPGSGATGSDTHLR